MQQAPHTNDPFASQTAEPAQPTPDSADWWMDVLKAQGIAFPDGAEATHDEETSELVVVNTEANLELVELYIDQLLTPAERAALGKALPPYQDSADHQNVIESKLNSIIFPTVQFQNATVEEALEFLRIKSRDLDPDPDPARKGVSLILKWGDSPNTQRINLDLKDVPFAEALRYVTELAGMKYKIEPYAVLVVPVSDTTTERHTRSFRVPPGFLDHAQVTQSRGTAIDILKQSGIEFPDGASAMYNPTTSQLIVTNTQPMLDLVEAYIDSLPAVSAAQPQLKVGLLPLDLQLPTAGVLIRLHGAQAPETLTLRFTTWERQLTHASLCILLGSGAFAAWGRRRPLWRTLIVGLLLTAGVSLIVPGWHTTANALLSGWWLGLCGWALWRLVAKAQRPQRTAVEQEVAA